MLATPLSVSDVAIGEMGWSLTRSTIYAASFLLVMTALGLVEVVDAAFVPRRVAPAGIEARAHAALHRDHR